MSTEMLTKQEKPPAATDEPRAAASMRAEGAQADAELRRLARARAERIRRLKFHVAAWMLGMFVLTPVWALTQWQDNGGFKRFGTDGGPGDWDPWIFYVALIWGFFVAIEALRTYFDRPTTEAEIEREIERLRSG